MESSPDKRTLIKLWSASLSRMTGHLSVAFILAVLTWTPLTFLPPDPAIKLILSGIIIIDRAFGIYQAIQFAKLDKARRQLK
ncbi:MAG: hypothetical protein JO316_26020 [Abitibacteriaceae bacterium]|nr:hypothetical protein [Abditibacteriaceae bacterium]